MSGLSIDEGGIFAVEDFEAFARGIYMLELQLGVEDVFFATVVMLDPCDIIEDVIEDEIFEFER